jgi:hypothetical protein
MIGVEIAARLFECHGIANPCGVDRRAVPIVDTREFGVGTSLAKQVPQRILDRQRATMRQFEISLGST